MTNTKMSLAVTAVLSAAVLLAGCGTQQQAADPAAAQQQQQQASSRAAVVDAAVVRGESHYDFPATRSVTEAARGASSVLLGTVVSWTDGRAVVESDGSGYADTSLTAVLAVKVDKAFSRGGVRRGDVVYVEVPRGGEITVDGKRPSGTTPVLTTVADLSEAVPTGTPLILLGVPSVDAAQLERTSGVSVRREGAGVPAGEALVRPTVQGLLFRDETGAFASGIAEGEHHWGWLAPGTSPKRGFSTLVAELGQRG